MSITGAAKLAGVVGWPVAHSRSPALHGYWLNEYKIDGAYVPVPIRPENLRRAIQAMPLLGFAGCNVTVPFKEDALRAVDDYEPISKRIGSINTIVLRPNGRLFGFSTDGYGFLTNLRSSLVGFNAAAGPAVVLGAGGAARAVVTALLDDGATEVRLVNRTPERATKLAKELGGPVRGIAWESRAEALSGAMLLVNATSLGMEGQPALELPLDNLPHEAVVNDIVYVPLETPLLAAARSRGNRVVDGLGMLLYQAQPGFEAWFGVKPEVTQGLRDAVLATLKRS